MINKELVRELCRLAGIQDYYLDHRNVRREIGESSLLALLAARGFDTGSEEALHLAISEFRNDGGLLRAPPVCVLRAGRGSTVRLDVPNASVKTPVSWKLDLEDGGLIDGSQIPAAHIVEHRDRFFICDLRLPSSLPWGYHRLTIRQGEEVRTLRLIVAPSATWDGKDSDPAGWGVSVQLYALRSRRNWGIGDFTDLAALARALGGAGADFLGINPLHALYPSNPEHASPYSPASRAFINYLYIDVEAVPEYKKCPAAQEKVASEYFQSRVRDLRARSHVDYSGVAFLKLATLRHLYDTFVTSELGQDTPRAQRFRDFCEQGGAALRQLSLFYTLYAHHRRASRNGGWMNWPDPFRDPASDDVRAFADLHEDTVRYYMYLQWLADEQLAAAHEAARESGMGTGLYRDLAVGIDASGADNWRNQALYCTGASVGAPPDAIALQGQDWGLPPMEPAQMQAEGYDTFITDLRDNMRHCGALRLDHAMQLMRLWWTPAGRPSSEGAYVHYPLEDLLGIVALESHRQQCRIIGEDLGVVPEEIRKALPRERIWSYKVVLFEKKPSGAFIEPRNYAPHALATLTTHDLPTLPGYWRGADLLLREELGLFPDPAQKEESWQERIRDRQEIVNALRREGLFPDGLPEEANSIDQLPVSLLMAMESFLAASASRMVCAQVEDWLGMEDPVNVPGTSGEYPNWRRRLTQDLEDIIGGDLIARHASALSRDHMPVHDHAGAGADASISATVPETGNNGTEGAGTRPG